MAYKIAYDDATRETSHAATSSSSSSSGHDAVGGVGADPMHQFEIHPLLPLKLPMGETILDFSLTNSSLWMILAALTVASPMLLCSVKMTPGRLQAAVESLYEFVADTTRDILGEHGRPLFPFVFSLFSFILACNMLGMLPYAFTVTSHIAVTLALALSVFALATLTGFVRHGFGYFRLFAPRGLPVWMMPILVPVEILSYFIRPLSLSVRLFANMMVGHTLLKVMAGFVVMMGVLGGWLPLAFMVAFTGLEILVAFLQAYVFAVLACIYFNDAFHPDH